MPSSCVPTAKHLHLIPRCAIICCATPFSRRERTCKHARFAFIFSNQCRRTLAQRAAHRALSSQLCIPYYMLCHREGAVEHAKRANPQRHTAHRYAIEYINCDRTIIVRYLMFNSVWLPHFKLGKRLRWLVLLRVDGGGGRFIWPRWWRRVPGKRIAVAGLGGARCCINQTL